jgi:hypothetical protein
MLEHIGGSHHRDTENIFVGVVLKEWLVKQHKVRLSPTATLILALAYVELYRRKNVHANDHWLFRAKELFDSYFVTVGGVDNEGSSKNVLMYCKLLHFMGLHDQTCEVIESVLPNFEMDPLLPTFLLMAGAAHKATGDFETANNYFFDSCQIGPPTPFSKIEMMTIISRNLEEMGNEVDDGEDAYKMVHAHLVVEGIIDEDTDYDDWIYDASTW